MEQHGRAFMEKIAGLFNRVELSDITFLIHGKPLPAHRFVVCIQSRYFEDAFRNFAESETKTMTLNAATEAAYWRVFKYLYTGDYPDDLADLTSEVDDAFLLRDARVYALADMFFLENLMELCVAKLKQKLRDGDDQEGFADCVREVYASTHETDKRLRSVVVKAAVSRKFATTKRGKELVHEGGDFVVDYFEVLK